MTLAQALEGFHFLRPLWLLAIPALVATAWLVRRSTRAPESRSLGIAPHLAQALTVPGSESRRWKPVDGVVAAAILSTLAAAGPTWSRVPNPFESDLAPMVIVLEVSETMLAVDVQPTRLERAKQKIRDLLELRAGGATALVAYAGTAHRVLPLTEDPEILRGFVEGLVPSVMPEPGQNATRALALGRSVLESAGESGVLLFVLDDLDPGDIAAFEKNASSGGPATLALVIGTEEGGPIQLEDKSFGLSADGSRATAPVDFAVFDRLSEKANTRVLRAVLGKGDLRRIDREARSIARSQREGDEEAEWEERGWWLLWPAALLGALWFRGGWTMRWLPALLLGFAFAAPRPASADTLADLFFTPDQQARWEYERLRFGEAGDRFEDPRWKGFALAQAGRYLEAADAFGRLSGADALFAMGTALVKGREYRRAIRAFDQALAEDPEHESAKRNRAIAEAMLTRVERLREEGDHGEHEDLGADGYKFDKEQKGGKTVQIGGAPQMGSESEAAWMRTVDPGTAAFLQIRFEIEAREAEKR